MHLAPNAVDVGVWRGRLACSEGLVATPEFRERHSAATAGRHATQPVRFRVEAVGIDERRVGHTQEELCGERVVLDVRGDARGRLIQEAG